jgi:hypothetical protein
MGIFGDLVTIVVLGMGAYLVYKSDILKELNLGGGSVRAPTTSTSAPRASTPASTTGLSTASEIANTETMTVPSGFGGVVITIPNEGHHAAGSSDCLTAKNCGFLPTKLVAPAGISVVWISDDAGHDHTIAVTGGQTTGAIKTDMASAAMILPTAGTFTYKSTKYPKQTGTITISGGKASGTQTAGAVFVPAGEIAAYTSIITGLGMKVTSSAAAGKVAIIVYTSSENASATAAKIAAVTKKTPWT